jgi:hypothetical protein
MDAIDVRTRKLIVKKTSNPAIALSVLRPVMRMMRLQSVLAFSSARRYQLLVARNPVRSAVRSYLVGQLFIQCSTAVNKS